MDNVKQGKKSKTSQVKNGESSFLSGSNMEVAAINYFRDELGRYVDGHPGISKRYETREALQEAIIKYFEHCEQTKQHLTMTGLAIALGFRTRQALVNYEKEEGYEFAHDVISYAKMRIQEATEQKLHDPKASIIGAIFSLKNNWGWTDKSEIRMDQRTLTFNGFEIEGLNDEKITINQD